MAPRRGTTRRRFLQTTALAAAGLAAPKAFSAAAPDLKLKKPIKIGCQTILSGPLGGYGEFMRKGATLAMEQINATGGIGGSPIEMNFRDEELKVDVGVKNARYFVDDWGADFLIGIDSSAVALAVGEIMPTLNKVLIVTHGATEKYNEDLVFKRHVRQCFRVCVPVYQDGIASALVAKDLPVKKWATISPDYEYGHTSWKMFRAYLKRFKPDVEFVGESFAKFGTVDFSSHISKVMGTNPEGIFSTEWGGEAVTMVKQAKLFKVFENTKAFMIGMGSAMDVMQGSGRGLPGRDLGVGPLLLGVPRHAGEQEVRRGLPQALRDVSELSLGDRVRRPLRAQEGGGEGEVDRDREGDRRRWKGSSWIAPPASASSARRTTRPSTRCPGDRSSTTPSTRCPSSRTSRSSPPTSTTASRRSRRSRAECSSRASSA